MSWEKSSYTTAGAALLSESLSGGALTITRAVSGTGIVETDLSAETTVSGETHELTILAIDTVKDGEETARKVSIQITGAESTYIIPDDAKFKAEVINNALDSSPVWQDATTEVKKGVNIVFENKTATNGAAFNFRVSVERGESGEGGYIEAVSGAFQ